MRKLFMLIFCLIIVFIIGTFTVDTRQNAIVYNQVTNASRVYKSGLHFALPFVTKVVYVYMNQRIRNYDVKTDSYQYMFMTTWKVIDPLKYYNNLDSRIDLISHIESTTALHAINNLTLESMLNQQNLLKRSIVIESLGVEVQGIRLISYNYLESITSDLPQQESMAIVNNDIQFLESIYYSAQKIKTEADLDSAKLYLPLQKTDPKFYEYYRLLEAYKKSAKFKQDLPPLSEIYK